MRITSHTLVRNGMPYIGKVLRQVAPFMDEMVICLSEGSNDGTEAEIRKVLEPYWDKVIWMTENVGDKVVWINEDVATKEELTDVENEMVRRSTGDWVLFLSDDDYWPEDQLKLCLAELDKDPNVLCYAVNPYQLIDLETHDDGWRNKWFSKFLRNKDLNFKFPWPQDMPYSGDISLYWRHSPDVVKKLPHRFYHLSYLKEGSFRKEEWATKWRHREERVISRKMPHKIEL